MWRTWSMLCVLVVCASVAADECPKHCTSSGFYKPVYKCITHGGNEITLQGYPGFEAEVTCPGDETCSDFPSLRYSNNNSSGKLYRTVTRECAPAQLQCMLRALRVNDTSSLKLYAPRAPLTADHVRGLNIDFLAFYDTYNIHSIPNDVLRELPKLNTLWFEGSQLTLTPGVFQDAPELDYIKLRANIDTLPPGTFRGLSKLKTLHMINNRFSVVTSGSFEGLAAMDDLMLINNKISALPVGVFSTMPLLRYLNINRNNLQELTSGVFTGQQLEYITISENTQPLTIHSKTFANLPKLTELYLDGCGISSLPSDMFQGTNNLIKLILRNNQLSTFPENMFHYFEGLKELDLKENIITTLDITMFAALKKLNTLLLSHNRIRVLPDELPTTLSSFPLTYLDLSENQLTSLDSGNIHFLSQFFSVSLKNNSIARVSLRDVRPYNRCKWQDPPLPYTPPSIYLEGNPLVCDCELYPLSLMAGGGCSPTVAAHFKLEYAKCAFPADQEGLLIRNIQPQQLHCS